MPRKRMTESNKKLLKDARELAQWLTAEKLALVNPNEESVELPIKREGSAPKRYRAGRLIEYSAIEALVELQYELKKHNASIPRIYTLYLYLRRIVNA